MWERLKNFFKGAQEELRHVNWPGRTEAIRLTLIVIGMSLGLAVFLGAFDYLFSYLLKTFLFRVNG